MQSGRYCVASSVGGIPDLYDGHKEAGLLLGSNDVDELSRGLSEAIQMLEAGKISPESIRARYFDGFDIASAHRAWLSCLELAP